MRWGVVAAAFTALGYSMEALQKMCEEFQTSSFKPSMTPGKSSEPMNMYNQGTLTGSYKKDLVGGFTLEQGTEGRVERVSFDKARMAAYEKFLKEEATPEDYKAAAPEKNYKEPKAPASVPEMHRLQGISTLKTIMTVAALLIHAFVTYSILLKVLSGLSPIVFWKKMKDAIMFAFSTASSNATIPVTMETATHRLGVSNKVASFTIPLGATINMDGTAIMQGVATAFIAQAFGVELSIGDYMTVILTATLASVGTAGVPGVGLIMLAMVLNQVGLPLEGIALIMGVDRLLDMIRTAVNITGDSVVTCIVAKSENELDIDAFNDPKAGEAELALKRSA